MLRTSRMAAAAALTLALGACGGPDADEQDLFDAADLSEALRRAPSPPAGAPGFPAVSQTAVTVTWEAARFATAYVLERAPDAGGAPGTFGRIATTGRTTQYVDAGLTPATAYWYRVRASSAAGTSPPSGAARVTTSAPAGSAPVPPPPPPPVVEPPPPPVVTPPPPPVVTPAPAGTTLRDAAARHGLVFGMGWGPPPWTNSEAIASSEFNAFHLPGTVGRVWKGPGSYDWSSPDFGVQYAASHPGFKYSSAQLFYGIFVGQNSTELVPAWLRGPDSPTGYGAPTVTPEQLSQHMKDFLTAYVQRYGTGAYRTEIANELVSYAQGDWYYQRSSIGAAGGKSVAQYVDTLARWAKAANPNVKLYLNETRNEDSQTALGTANGFGTLVRTLAAMGTPLDGLGFQCHQLLNGGYDFASIQGVFAYFASLGYDLHITEMGITAPVDGSGRVSAADQAAQAAQYRALVRAFLAGAGPRAKSIATWGTTDTNAFDRGGLLWDVDGRKKSAYQAVLDALNE